MKSLSIQFLKTRRKVLLLCFIGIAGFFLLFSFLVNNSQDIPPKPTPTEIPTPTFTPTSSLTPTPTTRPTSTPEPKLVTFPTSLDDLFAKYGSQYNVDPGLLKKIAGCESGFDPNQVTGDYAGLFQFASFAWVEARGRMGLSNDQNLRFNAEETIRTAAFEINYKGTSGWSDCD